VGTLNRRPPTLSRPLLLFFFLSLRVVARPLGELDAQKGHSLFREKPAGPKRNKRERERERLNCTHIQRENEQDTHLIALCCAPRIKTCPDDERLLCTTTTTTTTYCHYFSYYDILFLQDLIPSCAPRNAIKQKGLSPSSSSTPKV
jgi:hypothetical protein